LENFWSSFLLTFVPMFIVIDAVGNVPFVMSITEGVSIAERRRIIHLACFTATLVGLAFLFFGQLILNLMGISFGSFAIAGGIVLLVLSIRFMTTGHMVDMLKGEMVAVVPIGTPLTVGPATITTLLLLAQQFSIFIVLLSFILNMFINWLIFLQSSRIIHFLGQGGLKAFSRVLSLLLAAIAVSMILRGLYLVGLLEKPP
jgi:multiple antibiotic resistance protein